MRTDMDAWLRTHVAFLFPSIAPAVYASGSDRMRLARTRDLLVLAARAVREGFRVLHALDIPITPPRLRMFTWLPEPLLVVFLRRLLRREEMDVALIGHAEAARDEVVHLVREFFFLVRQTKVKTPAIDRLLPYLSPETPLMPDGSSEVRMRIWR